MNALDKSNSERWMMTAIAFLLGATISLWVVELSSYVSTYHIVMESSLQLFGIALFGGLTGLALFEAIDFIHAFVSNLYRQANNVTVSSQKSPSNVNTLS